MRISSLTMKNNYISTLNTNQKRLYDANLKAATGRRFKTMSEDVALGLRSMKVRRDLSKIVSYKDNVKECQSVLKATEETVREGMIRQAEIVQEKYQMALNGTSGPDEYVAIDAEITKLQEEILKSLNASFAGRYLYGGSQLTTDGAYSDAPFTVDNVSGKLMYKGVLVEELDPAHPNYDPAVADKLTNDPVYIDIGLGMQLDASGNPIPSTVFNRSFVGLDLTGVGENNIYDVITRIRDTLKTGTLDPDLLTKIENANKKVIVTVAKLGADDSFLTFTQNRLKMEEDNLIERQQGLEFVEEEDAILEFSMQQYTYNACLQMGAKLLQPSLFAYIG